MGLAVALNIFGQVIQLSHWVLDVSPFTHVPRLPGGTVPASPLFWLSVIALALGATGLAALRRRDIGSALSRSCRWRAREHPLTGASGALR